MNYRLVCALSLVGLLGLGAGCANRQTSDTSVTDTSTSTTTTITAPTSTAATCPGTQHACQCATGSYCLPIGAMCINPSAPCPTPNPPPKIPTTNTDAPVVFTNQGVLKSDATDDRFTLKILSANTIEQVTIHFACKDASGSVVDESDFAWKNIIFSHAQPIVQGETYTDDYYADKDVDHCDAHVTRVSFADGTSWKP